MQGEKYMRRCLELASNGLGYVAPNPLVGCVIVHNDAIIGEGYHRSFGTPHAEINALNAVKDRSLLQDSTLYVNLEPCSHYGKTPPCCEVIIKSGIKHVVLANQDPNKKVNGNGIKKMRDAGIDVQEGLLSEEAMQLNRRFHTFHTKNRPYIILKWAQTSDGFIDQDRADNSGTGSQISSEESLLLVHKWRSEEQAIMVGKNTVLQDNPLLTTRMYAGQNPLRIVTDKRLELDSNLHVFNNDAATLVLNAVKDAKEAHAELIAMDFTNFHSAFNAVMYQRNVQSVFVEGGSKLLQSFIDNRNWDEARIFTSRKKFGKGVSAPQFNRTPHESFDLGSDTLDITFNRDQ